MNNKKVVFLIGIIIVFVLGLVMGLNIGNNENKGTIRELISIKKSCTYKNKVYKSGQGMPAGDECNSCSCQNGQVQCTLIACAPR